ncbi:unannotated protein [freshwater metagenome]|uniref:Unannotated protein n=1 Tax=freshwater metagenome TaxID=449393 RepID=A0A6J7MH81_9ZZZZ
MDIRLTGHLLLRREVRLDLADIDPDHSWVRPLLDDPGDQIAFPPGELHERDIALGLAKSIEEHLLGSRRGDAPEAGGRVVVFANGDALLIDLGCVDDDVARLPIELDPGALGR